MRTSLFCFCLMSVVFETGFAVLLYRYNSSEVTWSEARHECVDKGGNLVNGSFEKQLSNCTAFPQNSNFWVGTYDTFSTWIQIVGCFRENATLTIGQHKGEDALSCAEKCSTHYGITSDACYCLHSNFTSEQIAVADHLCNQTCSGNEQDSCGGEGYFTVYKTVPDSGVTPRIDEPNRNEIMCGCVECTNSGWEYFGYSCNQSLKAYCNNKNISNEIEHWNDAQESCWTNEKSFLIGDAIDEVACVKNTSKSPHWVGLYRRKVTRTLNDAESPSVTDCFSGLLSAGILHLNKNVNCTQELPFICELDTDDILSTDCLLEPLGTTTSIPTTEMTSDMTTTDLMMSSDMTTNEPTTASKPTTRKAPTASAAKDESSKLSAGALAAIIIAVSIFSVLLIGTIMCHVICGKKPPSKKDEYDDTVQFRNKDDFYGRPQSFNQDMTEIRYSLFDDDKNILEPEEPDKPKERPIVPEVRKTQTEDGRFSTFVTIKQVNGDEHNGVVNTEDQLTKL